MRKKIEELRNKEDGFTLVELLAVIVILGIIVAIAIPAIGNVTETAQDGADKAGDELILDAARLYYTSSDVGDDEPENPVSVSKLIEDGYLDERGEGISAATKERTISRDADGGVSFDVDETTGNGDAATNEDDPR